MGVLFNSQTEYLVLFSDKNEGMISLNVGPMKKLIAKYEADHPKVDQQKADESTADQPKKGRPKKDTAKKASSKRERTPIVSVLIR